MQLIEPISPEVNLIIRLLDPKTEKVLDQEEYHNVFTNHGREWLAASNRVLGPVPGPDGTRKIDTLPYYIAVGQGSDQQSISPPGAGVQVESATVTYLEDPVLYQSGLYLAELDRPTTEPDLYTNRYEKTFQQTDISFGASTSVPVTEFGLVTKNAVATTPGGKKLVGGGPYAGTYDNGYLIAYRAIPPIVKTGLFKLQVLWELRF
jgi:hypothetical protein